jgi:hypothetical protein
MLIAPLPHEPEKLPCTFVKNIAVVAVRSAPARKASYGVARPEPLPLAFVTACVPLNTAMMSSH